MTLITFWKQLIKRYPQWSDPDIKITLTARGLKKMIEMAHENGFEQGQNHKKQKANNKTANLNRSHEEKDIYDFFKNMF